MTKQDRLSLIRARATVICRTALPGLIPVSRREIGDTVAEETALALQASDDSTLDPEEMGFASELATAFDRVREAQEREEETLLNRAERDQLAKDLREYKKRFWLALIPANHFVA